MGKIHMSEDIDHHRRRFFGAAASNREQPPMAKSNTSEDIAHHRRRFFGAAAMTVAAAQLARVRSADAQSSTTRAADLPKIKPGTNTSLGALKQIDAGVLNV